ncbi:hypothetical protein HY338_03345 [Candidatus Gottesmanbacteria bacterium]|nr:hypothetical protein [Candidatus Gottesmanbacteria bacterium]
MRRVVAELGATLGGAAPLLSTVILGPNFLSNPWTMGSGVVVAAVSTFLAGRDLFGGPKTNERYLRVTGEESLADVQKSAMRHGGIPINAEGMKPKKHDAGFIAWLGRGGLKKK